MTPEPQGQYRPSEIEPKWQAYWAEQRTFHIGNPGAAGFDATKPKYYILDMFPYTSGSGLHVGHPEGYTATDILSRYKRMKGFNVLHPMGWDSFGLPAEQHAVQTNVHPRLTTENAIKTFKTQLRRFGFSYDWDREFATTDLKYYKWTQWIFLKMFNSWFDDTAEGRDEDGKPYQGKARPIEELIAELESGKWLVDESLSIVPAAEEPRASTHADFRTWASLSKKQQGQLLNNHRLAYIDEVPVNWCPMLGTVLANEEVTNQGRSDRGDFPVYRKPLEQWMLRITKYCERLIADIHHVDWPEPIKAMQRNWVGKSTGAEVDFKLAQPLEDADSVIRVFTTRPDTLFGATYMVLAPEHPLVEKIISTSRGLQPTRTTDSERTPPRDSTPAGPSVDAKIWLLTWTTYGTWLPGDPRGFVGRVPTEGGLHAIHNAPGEPYDADDAQLLSDAANVMKAEPLHLDRQHAEKLGMVLEDVASRHGIDLLCFSIMQDHAHVLCRADQPPEDLLQLFKGNASRALSKEFGEPKGRWWTRSGSKRLIKRDPTTAYEYVRRQDNILASRLSMRENGAPKVASAGAEAPGSGGSPRDAVMAYVTAAKNKSDLDRTADTKDKTGVFTGAYAINPVNDERIPIWVADYVLMGYGTGAIMAVPAHDTRDFEFAKQFELEIRPVVSAFTVPHVHYELIRKMQSANLSNYGCIGFMRRTDWTHTNYFECYFATLDGAERFVTDHQAIIMKQSSIEQHPTLPYTDDGNAINSGEFDGLSTADFRNKIVEWLEERGLGKGDVNYKLRDWLFSRQRYWGEPFPILHGPDGELVGLDESDLPLDLPHMEDFKPDASDDPDAPPRPPLARAKDWVSVQRDGKTYTRELNTMPQWAGSCWYYLRYLDAKNDDEPWNREAEQYWMNVDQYVGGAEHAVLHLLYARFWHKVLFDLGYVSTIEPFQRLFNQGLILSFAFKDKRGITLGVDQVDEREEGKFFSKESGEPVEQIVAKMSKALKNVVNPDGILDEFGADTFRLYEMYMGPLDASKPWNTRDIPGLSRFLNRVWRLIIDEQSGELAPAVQEVEPDEQSLRGLHKVIKKVGEDIEEFKFNTAIAEMIAFTNKLTSAKVRSKELLEQFVLVLAPFAPHICEELWRRLGHGNTLAYEPWPAYDAEVAKDSEVEVPVQVNGKIKTRITLPADTNREAMEAAALAEDKVKQALAGKTVRKVIVVPGKLVNIVAN